MNKFITIKSQKIAILRNALALSYAKFGMPCGYVGGYISCVERGKVNVSDEFCEKISTAYGIEKNWLMDDNIAVEPILYVNNVHQKGEAEENATALCTPGERLRSVLQDSGLSQKEFCNRIGASTSMLGPLMDGRRQITQRYAEKVEKTFHVGAEWLLYGREECKENPCGDEMIAFLKVNPDARKVVKELMKKAEK